jgi:hemolysin activation/secretion protein
VTVPSNPFGSRSSSLHYSIPWRYWLFSGSLYQSDYKQTIAGFSNNNVQSGESQGAELKGVYMLYRTARAKGSIPFKFSHQKRRSYIDDAQIEVQYNHVSDYETGFKHNQLLGAGSVEISLLQKGSLRGESDAPGFIIGVPDWDGRYRAYTTDIICTCFSPQTISNTL